MQQHAFKENILSNVAPRLKNKISLQIPQKEQKGIYSSKDFRLKDIQQHSCQFIVGK